MKQIFKYVFATHRSSFALPIGAQILSVQIQHGSPALWALVDPSAPSEPRTFQLFATGEQIPDGRRNYITTLQDRLGLVWHVFEELP